MALLDKGSAEARALVDELEALVARQRLARTFLSLTEVRLELDLRRERPGESNARVKDELAAAVRRGDLSAQCVCYLMLARVHVARRELRDGRTHAETSLALAQEHGFRKEAVRARLCLAGVAFLQGDVRRCLQSLRGASALTVELGLPVLGLCVRAALSLVDPASASEGRAVLRELSCAPSGLPEALHLLRFYGFLNGARVSSDGASTEPLETAFPAFRSVRAVVSFEGAGFVAAFTERGADTAELGGVDDVSTLGRWVLARPIGLEGGFTLEIVHGLFYARLAYREIAHRGRAQALVARLRRRLAPVGIEIRFDAASRSYITLCAGPLVRARVDIVARTAPSTALTERETALLAFLRAQGRSETSALCAHFACTRQTLHPMLKKLERLGHAQLRTKGPRSVYLASADEGATGARAGESSDSESAAVSVPH